MPGPAEVLDLWEFSVCEEFSKKNRSALAAVGDSRLTLEQSELSRKNRPQPSLAKTASKKYKVTSYVEASISYLHVYKKHVI